MWEKQNSWWVAGEPAENCAGSWCWVWGLEMQNQRENVEEWEHRNWRKAARRDIPMVYWIQVSKIDKLDHD